MAAMAGKVVTEAAPAQMRAMAGMPRTKTRMVAGMAGMATTKVVTAVTVAMAATAAMAVIAMAAGKRQ